MNAYIDSNKVIIGDTVKLFTVWRDYKEWDASDDELPPLITPSNMKVTVYDRNKNVMEEYEVEPEDEGLFYLEWEVTDKGRGPLSIEWRGKVGAKPATRRMRVIREWELK